MIYPNFLEEKKLRRRGFIRIVGLDEAGRGPLAGPVISAAVTIIPGAHIKKNLRRFVVDSKQLSSKKREEAYDILSKHPRVIWGTGRVSERIIDRINILEATKLSMKRAVQNLQRKQGWPADFLVIDGTINLKINTPQKLIIKADVKVFSCAAASIIAKVTRDEIMQKYHIKYPEYGFNRHKGYGTSLHLKMLKRYGSCFIHRKSFKPVKYLIS